MKKKEQNLNKTKKNQKWAFRHRHTGIFRLLYAFSLGGIFFCAVFIVFLFILLPATERHDSGSKISAADALPVDPADSFNMLLITNDDAGNPAQLMLLRLDASKRLIYVMPVPAQLGVENNSKTLGGELRENGVDSAISDFESLTRIKINFHCVISSANLTKVLSLFGGFLYDVPYRIAYDVPESNRTIDIQTGNNFIDGAKAMTLISYSGYDEGSFKRYEVQAGLMKAFAGQKLTDFYLKDSGAFFKNVFNFIDTDFSMIDLLNRLDSLKAVAAKKNFAVSLIPVCTTDTLDSENIYIFDKKTLDTAKKYFAAGK